MRARKKRRNEWVEKNADKDIREETYEVRKRSKRKRNQDNRTTIAVKGRGREAEDEGK